jgi:SAM-dependent methyltransferase
MKRKYDTTIKKHYQKVAEDCGSSATSTMADELTRQYETEAILQFVSASLKMLQKESLKRKATIMDIGCGNGYTLEKIIERYPEQHYVGIEHSDDLRTLASSRFEGNDNVNILEGDIRDPHFAEADSVDILLCQRVLINLLDLEDQRSALNNIIEVVSSPRTSQSGGTLLFIEAFSSYLANLNKARAELDLPPIPPAHHNLYLPDNFFDTPRLRPFVTDDFLIPPNFLSTHYFVTRVFYPLFIQNKPLKRNTEFVRFFSAALKENIGDYSPLRLYIYKKEKKHTT